MKKKAITRIAEDRQKRIELLEELLGKRKRQIRELQLESKGQKQMIQILTGIVLEGIERSERVEVLKENLAKGLKCGYTLKETADAYILEKTE